MDDKFEQAHPFRLDRSIMGKEGAETERQERVRIWRQFPVDRASRHGEK
jgi:hypothetical protein